MFCTWKLIIKTVTWGMMGLFTMLNATFLCYEHLLTELWYTNYMGSKIIWNSDQSGLLSRPHAGQGAFMLLYHMCRLT